ncbi:purple acid phosphatase family protein [Sandaracinus amylolyticus]|nr:metallophosphoesterase family protein [Sandaracinus amylolyticus]
MRLRTSMLAIAITLLASTAHAQRTPYLQSPTETSIIVRWRSASAQPSSVCWGTSPSALTNRAGSGSATDHTVRITGLTPDTQYYYATAQSTCPPASAADARDTFRTAPRRGSTRPFRMWVVGDSGTGGSDQRAVRDAMLGATTGRRPDLFLHMGDMAYSSGTTSEFDSRFFAMYSDILRQTPCWPTMGNHEGSSSDSATQSGPYYDAYTLPTDGSAGGLPSGTEAYYAFDWGNVHFVVLDSHESPRGTTGAMLRWLDEDLAATDATWVIAYFHHPPYTDGTHDSDTERQHIDMRQNALPILEAHGVDLVLGGHSHIYERSYLVRGAFDTPTTAGGHLVDTGDGQLDGDGPYRSGTEGTLYVVAGHGGASVGGDASHPVMFFSETEHGSCIIDVDGEQLTLRNVRSDGAETDHVTLMKRDGLFLARPSGGERYLAGSVVPIAWASVGEVGPLTIEISLDGGASWSTLVERTENDGMHDWATPRRESDHVRVRIRESDDATNVDESEDFVLAASARDTVIAFGDVWQYSDDDTAHGDGWRTGAGGTWPEGRGELGYGDGDEATELHDATPNFPTVYFRRRIELASEVDFARVRAVYDDGVAIFVNGTQVASALVDDLAHEAWSTSGAGEEATLDATLDLAAGNPFVVGENWIAAVVKQSNGTSSDLSFDLELELGLRVEIDPEMDGGIVSGEDAGAIDGAIDRVDGSNRVDGATTVEPASSGCGCRAAGRGEGPGAIALGVLALLALVVRRRR